MAMRSLILKGSFWTVLTYVATEVIRFFSNAILTRLLAPELFGLMTIVNAIRTGLAFISEAGVAQNVIIDKDADNPDFYNTAWTVNVLRGVAIWLICAISAVPLSNFYKLEEMIVVLPISAFVAVFTGFTSLAPIFLQKRLQFVRLNLFDFATDAIGLIAVIVWATFSPTIWALVIGGFVGPACRLAGSYLLDRSLKHKLHFSTVAIWKLLRLSKWIYLSSVAFFFSLYVDRLFFGKVFPLSLLGIYGIARALSQPFGMLVSRLGSVIIFPMIAAASELPRASLRRQVSQLRLVFLLTTAIGLSLLIANSDVIVSILYDPRYQSAGWMAAVLFVGAWFTTLSNLNESTLLGLSKPLYGAASNSIKLTWLILALPTMFWRFGVEGAVLAVSASDIIRYIPILAGQIKEDVSFVLQDAVCTIVLISLVICVLLLRNFIEAPNMIFQRLFEALYTVNAIAR